MSGACSAVGKNLSRRADEDSMCPVADVRLWDLRNTDTAEPKPVDGRMVFLQKTQYVANGICLGVKWTGDGRFTIEDPQWGVALEFSEDGVEAIKELLVL